MSYQKYLNEALYKIGLQDYVLNNKVDENLKPKYDTPIILRGFVRRQDGIGAHLPNLYDNVFNEYKNVSFSLPEDRWLYHFAFLNDLYGRMESAIFHPDMQEPIQNTKLDIPEIIKTYKKDLDWIIRWKNLENYHIRYPEKFFNGHLLHVSGFCGDLEREYNQNFLNFYQFKKQLKCKLGLYLMWESKGLASLDKVISIYDYVVVTNTWLKSELEKQYPNKPIKIVEHIANYYDVPSEGNTERFTFGFSGGLWERKKVGLVMESFSEVRDNSDILKIHSRLHSNTEAMMRDFTEIFNKYNKGIEFNNETLPDKEFAEWWDSLNCYVFISAGESYSITPRQALMQGIPVILSKNTSHLDLIDIPGILWVDCVEQNTAKFSGNAELGHSVGSQFEPIKKDVIKCMKEVKSNYAYWKKSAIEGGKKLKEITAIGNIKNQWGDILKCE